MSKNDFQINVDASATLVDLKGLASSFGTPTVTHAPMPPHGFTGEAGAKWFDQTTRQNYIHDGKGWVMLTLPIQQNPFQAVPVWDVALTGESVSIFDHIAAEKYGELPAPSHDSTSIPIWSGVDLTRQTDRTSEQMRRAAPNAIFIWCNDALTYPRDLALRLGRSDLEIHGPSDLSNGTLWGRAANVIVDHAATLTSWQEEVVRQIDIPF